MLTLVGAEHTEETIYSASARGVGRLPKASNLTRTERGPHVTKIWSTATVHPRDRMAYWVDEICHNCQVDCEPRRGTAFFGEAALTDLAGVLQVGQGASSAQVFSRSPRQIARGNADFLQVTVQTSGRALVSQDGGEAVLEPGDLVLTDRTRPYQFTCDDDMSQTVLIVPRPLLMRRIGSAERFTAMRIDGNSGFGGLLSPMLRNLIEQQHHIQGEMPARVAENVLDLIATALLSVGEQAPISAGMTRVRVKFWIETHLAEELSGERIASACRLSVRHLNRVFAGEGTSLMHYVWGRRLARCRRDLTDPRMCHRPIGEIALAAGFKDLSHFSRAYRARYGRTAREEREALAGAN
jgi:AraC-like DNA-binding protein